SVACRGAQLRRVGGDDAARRRRICIHACSLWAPLGISIRLDVVLYRQSRIASSARGTICTFLKRHVAWFARWRILFCERLRPHSPIWEDTNSSTDLDTNRYRDQLPGCEG